MTTSHTSTGVQCVCVVNPAGDFAGFDECGRIVWGTLDNARTFVRDSELSMDCAEEFLASCRLTPECGGSRFVNVTTYRAEESKTVELDTPTSPTPPTQGTPTMPILPPMPEYDTRDWFPVLPAPTTPHAPEEFDTSDISALPELPLEDAQYGLTLNPYGWDLI